MASALTGNSIFYTGPTSNVKLHAPSTFSLGSSVSHVNQIFSNELMVSSFPINTFIHHPGKALPMIEDFGWKFTYILHDPLPNVEDFNQSFDFVVEVFSDDGFDTTSLKLHYSTDQFVLEDSVLDMAETANANEYMATIPNPGEGTTFNYYITVTDTDDRVFSDPGQAPDIAVFEFTAAIDDSVPNITHTPVDFLLETRNEVEILATIFDYFMGLDTTYVEFKINGVDQPSIAMKKDKFNLLARKALLNLAEAKAGDIISYRIVAIDISQAQNTAFHPESGFHEFNINSKPDPIAKYYNDFNLPINKEVPCLSKVL